MNCRQDLFAIKGKKFMGKYIYLQRHGESETNVKHLLTCRKLDPSLTHNGRKQVESKLGFYGNRAIEMIAVSPSKRARETAQIISDHLKMSFSIDENLMEIDTGEQEGMDLSIPEVSKGFYDVLNSWVKGVEKPFPGGEKLFDVKRRIESLKKKYFEMGKNIILVGHSAFFSILLAGYIKSDNVRELFIYRGGIAEYSIEKNEWSILDKSV
jgi:broad specificity phosphatase PhoE